MKILLNGIGGRMGKEVTRRVLDGYKDTYYVGDRIDMTTLVVRVEYVNGGGLDMMLLEEMVSYDFSTPGTATVTVAYNGMVATYTVTVLEAPATEAPTTEPENETEPESETVPETQTVDSPVTDSEDLIDEPAVQNGCKATLVSLSALVLVLAGLALGKKED